MSGPVSDHYNQADLLARIERALGELGRTPDTVTADDLAGIEEFHIGGRAATVSLISALELEEGHTVLDVGCGTGGTARFVAARSGARVEGVDLTPSFIETGKTLTSWLNLTSRVHLHLKSAVDTGFDDASFDAAYMFHVGMNIEDKRALFCEIARVLKPGGRFLVYDIMTGETAEAPLAFPLPWSSLPETSFLCTADTYERHLEAAGLAIEVTRPRHDIGDRFFDQIEANAGTPPAPLSIGALMGENAADKVANLREAYRAGRVMPVHILAHKPVARD